MRLHIKMLFFGNITTVVYKAGQYTYIGSPHLSQGIHSIKTLQQESAICKIYFHIENHVQVDQMQTKTFSKQHIKKNKYMLTICLWCSWLFASSPASFFSKLLKFLCSWRSTYCDCWSWALRRITSFSNDSFDDKFFFCSLIIFWGWLFWCWRFEFWKKKCRNISVF